jgi:hypothetical protein
MLCPRKYIIYFMQPHSPKPKNEARLNASQMSGVHIRCLTFEEVGVSNFVGEPISTLICLSQFGQLYILEG